MLDFSNEESGFNEIYEIFGHFMVADTVCVGGGFC